MTIPKTLIIIPTYNEVVALPKLVQNLAMVIGDHKEVDVLVVDDCSPDGTGKVVRRLKREFKFLHLLERDGERGLGLAYIDGYLWGLKRNYELFVQMDADGSHPVDVLPHMVSLSNEYGLVVGSRYVSDGLTLGWAWYRLWLSRAANWYARTVLRVPVKDITSGFKVYTREAVEEADVASLGARGYYFQIEMTTRVWDSGLGVVEVPITFRERVDGRSKMRLGIIIESFVKVLGLARDRRPRRIFSFRKGTTL